MSSTTDNRPQITAQPDGTRVLVYRDKQGQRRREKINPCRVEPIEPPRPRQPLGSDDNPFRKGGP